ncbi:MAG: hypothetical protein E7262_02930 [Lachnospiraceae bacterium]|nr:hypothetical protein [Lachnospiraceae bacterium]
MKKFVVGLCLIIVMMSVAGCDKQSKDKDQDVLTISLTHNNIPLIEALRKEFKDIEFRIDDYYGNNPTEYYSKKLECNDYGDILINTIQLNNETAKDKLLDISGYGFVGNYQTEMLKQYDVDGGIYQLPGPVMIRSMAYNKTLFKEKGWKEPKNHKELVKLCKKIRKETDITPISFGAVGVGYYFTTMTTYAQTKYLTEANWIKNEKNYLKGKASCSHIFADGIKMVEDLIQANAFDVEKNEDFWDTQAIEYMVDRKSAMVNIWACQDKFIELTAKSKDEFELIPFYNNEGDALLGTIVSAHVGLSKSLGKKENKKKLENAIRVMEWLAKEENMNYMKSGETEIMPLENADNSDTAEVYSDVWEANISGMKAPMLYTNYEDIMIETAEFIKDAMIKGDDLGGLVELIDKRHKELLKDSGENAILKVTDRFTHEQTIKLMADVILTNSKADIALLSDSEDLKDGVPNRYGVGGKLYEGNYYSQNINVCVPGEGDKIVTTTLTGKQIRKLVEEGKYETATRVDDESKRGSAYFRYLWTGMDVTMKDGKVVSMKLSDGKEIKDKDKITVAFSDTDIPEDKKKDMKLKDQGITCLDAFMKYIEEHDGVLSPKDVK